MTLSSMMLSVVWWAVLLRWISGSSDATTVPIVMSGPHMQMTTRVAERPGDRERAAAVLSAARQVVVQFENVSVAEHAAYKEFAPGSPGIERHFVNARLSGAEAKQLDTRIPRSIATWHDMSIFVLPHIPQATIIVSTLMAPSTLKMRARRRVAHGCRSHSAGWHMCSRTRRLAHDSGAAARCRWIRWAISQQDRFNA